ncbi:hypothetical protein TPR58_22010 [Sphingomonas sp. HF-S3]|uniref:Lipoprotein n=1 Tax=Sphingomonas rustica TaxID=3103142 RepID=A0ABV0BFI9_9SPHN
MKASLRLFTAVLTLAALSACVPAAEKPARATRPGPPPPPPPPSAMAAGLGRVMGQTGPRLIATLGKPTIDFTEGAGRKLQFAGPICVLDAYLYPRGRSEPVVTHVDARQRDGKPIDQASCVAALTKR